MKDPDQDRRSFTRIPFHTQAEIRTGSRIIRSSNGIDVSMNGMRMETPDAVPAEGAPCSVTITLRAAEEQVRIEAQGHIVRSRGGTMAVRFNEIDLDSYTHLRQLILSNTDEPERAEREFNAHWGIRKPLA